MPGRGSALPLGIFEGDCAWATTSRAGISSTARPSPLPRPSRRSSSSQAQVRALPRGLYPPALAGLRGSTDDAYAVIHGVAREGRRYDIDKLEAEETYDLVVIGAGLAGLTAAWAYRERRPRARILILDNHDDFGGHARRCEFRVGNRLLLSYGGSESMVSPKVKYAGELGRILRALRIYPERFERERVFHRQLYPKLGLSKSVFFDRETFGEDRLVTGDPLMLGFDEFAPDNPGARPIDAFLADCPLSGPGAAAVCRSCLPAGATTWPGNRRSRKSRPSPRPATAPSSPTSASCRPTPPISSRAARATTSATASTPSARWMRWARAIPAPRRCGIEDKAGGHAEDKAAYIHHFPDGNASLARALVRSLVEGVAPGRSMEDLVTAAFDYPSLDRLGAPVRVRLQSTAVRVRNTADGSGVDVGYVKDGELRRVRAGSAVVATYATVMPYLCPELERDPVELLLSNVKAPLVYTKVVVRNWQSFVRLGTHKISAPTSFHTTVKLDYPVSLGGYKFPRRPTDPMAAASRACAAGARPWPRHAHAGAHRPQPAAGHELRRFREGDPPGPRPHAGQGRVRCGPRHPRHHRQSLVARLFLHAQQPLRRRGGDAGRGSLPRAPSSATSCSPTPTRPGTPMRIRPWKRRCVPSASCWATPPAEVRQPWYTRFLRRFSKQ